MDEYDVNRGGWLLFTVSFILVHEDNKKTLFIYMVNNSLYYVI